VTISFLSTFSPARSYVSPARCVNRQWGQRLLPQFSKQRSAANQYQPG